MEQIKRVWQKNEIDLTSRKIKACNLYKITRIAFILIVIRGMIQFTILLRWLATPKAWTSLPTVAYGCLCMGRSDRELPENNPSVDRLRRIVLWRAVFRTASSVHEVNSIVK
jgi:hypothetical protein